MDLGEKGGWGRDWEESREGKLGQDKRRICEKKKKQINKYLNMSSMRLGFVVHFLGPFICRYENGENSVKG